NPPQGRIRIEKAPLIAGHPYCGVERMNSFDLAQAFYAKQLTADEAALFRHLKDANADITGLLMVPDVPSALELLHVCNRLAGQDINEVIAVSSPDLMGIKGEHSVPAEALTPL